MELWWEGLSTLNRVFVCSAVIFTLLFAWQIVMTAVGVDSHDFGHAGSAETHADSDPSAHDVAHDLGSGAFVLISVRSMLAFATIFSWSGSLYLADNAHVLVALSYSFLWGFLAMLCVSAILHFFLGMQEQGNISAAWAIGEEGTVYIDIPANGLGKVRLLVRGVMSVINACSKSGVPIKEGAKVKVVNIVNQNTVEVIELWDSEDY